MTILWTSETLRRATGGTLEAEVMAGGVSIDTRTIQQGDLFVALVGTRDGHDHVAEAFARGAACAMVHAPNPDPRCLHVPNTQDALIALGRFARARFAGKVVAVTGSVGKTTTKDMLAHALGAYGPPHASVASYNNHWGVPLTLARLPPEAAFCISEIGMNHAGEIAPLAAQVQPHVAIISTIGTSHIGNMGSLEAIAIEKGAIFSGLMKGGTAIIPDDAPYAQLLEKASKPANLRHAGLSATASDRAVQFTADAQGCHFTFQSDAWSVPVRLHVAGPHLARNAISVLAAIVALDLDPAPGAASLAHWRPGAGRGLQQPILAGKATLLDESYNASPLAVRASLATLALLPATRRVAVLGDMLEMGDFADAAHKALATDVEATADLVFCCGTQMKSLFDTLPERLRAGYAADSQTLALMVRESLKAGDCVLVKGSFGSKMRVVVEALR